jgi:hypothetical protein
MRRRNGTGRLLRREEYTEDVNPMDFVGNLADVMLVFACGLMLALITYWNVDVAATAEEPDTTQTAIEITEDVSGADTEDNPESGDLEQYGTVYRDPETGKLYIMAEGGE